jgi:hypothetical protein
MSEAEAGKAATEITDAHYSGKNLDLMYENKQFQTYARILTGAPNWLRSTVDLGTKVPKSLATLLKDPKNPVARAYAKSGARTLATYAAANLAQKAATGKFMWENAPGQQFTMDTGTKDSEGKSRGISVFNSAADMYEIPLKAAKAMMSPDGKSAGNVIADTAISRSSPIVRAALAAAQGEDFKGEVNLAGDKDLFNQSVPTKQRLANTFSQALNFGPQQFSQPYNYATGRASLEEALAKVGELPLSYGRTKKGSKLSFAIPGAGRTLTIPR